MRPRTQQRRPCQGRRMPFPNFTAAEIEANAAQIAAGILAHPASLVLSSSATALLTRIADRDRPYIAMAEDTTSEQCIHTQPQAESYAQPPESFYGDQLTRAMTSDSLPSWLSCKRRNAPPLAIVAGFRFRSSFLRCVRSVLSSSCTRAAKHQ